ncbi:gene transfer agent family protein [Notoacmeibacter sp. MSK16QG-6]|uniref:gene transfer agent family protein n=1 Tax=Notoacmeibacter sp. MSK16QG-6 TaxID=2957982 RepID=UPI0020A0EDAC|nr:gene transfer agent family protein [Notoacmeibacter sp. MSK16QG-6]MCP1198130.1 gene transfer agent family protein [Notoacmeibacter sp. MSK16QG-6]
MVAANAQRGEIVAILDGRPHRLCLTLGGLAELETAFGADGLSELAARFSEGRFSASDLTTILAAGLRGGGAPDVDEQAVSKMRCDDGIAGFASIVVRLLLATFGQDATANDEMEDSDEIGPFD